MPTPLLLLHGALGARSQFNEWMPGLSQSFTVQYLDFEGHGAAPMRARPFRIEHFVENVSAYLDERHWPTVDVFGYSLGGYVAAQLARTQLGRVRRLMTLGTKWFWNPDSAAREVQLLDADKIKTKVPQFARALAARHSASGSEKVLAATAELLTHLGQEPVFTEENLRAVTALTRLMVGDRDTTAGVEDTVRAYRALPNAQLEILPNSPHPLEQVERYRITRAVIEFFDN